MYKVLRARTVNEIHVQILAIMFIGNYSCGIIIRVSLLMSDV